VPDLGMDGAGVDRAGGRRRLFRFRFRRVEIFGGIGLELGTAAIAAEMVGRAVVLEAVLRGLRVDAHAADGIARGLSGVTMVVMMLAAGVTSTRLCGLAHSTLRPLETDT